jgi:hypothetical protein
MQRFETLDAGEADAAAADQAANLRISRALTTILVMGKRLVGVLRLLGICASSKAKTRASVVYSERCMARTLSKCQKGVNL